LKGGIIGAIATIANAQSLLTPVDYSSTLDLYYYFRNGDAIAAITNDGINIEGSFSSNSELCSVLDGAQIVYSADGGDDVLLTSNCLSVYHLVDSSNDEITWTSCQEFPFYQSYCPSGSSSASSTISGTSSSAATTTLSSTATAANPNTLSGSETLYLTTVTSTINNIETSYTTYCPLSEITASHSESLVSGGTTNLAAVPVVTSTYTTTQSGSESTYTSLIPVSGSATAGAGPQKTFVDNTDFYESSSAAADATSISDSETYVLTTVTSTIDNIATIYTTYCPLSDLPHSAGTSSIASETPAPITSSGVSTVASETTAPITSSGISTAATSEAHVASSSVVESTYSSVVTSDNGEVSTIIIVKTQTLAADSTNATPSSGVATSPATASSGSGSGSVVESTYSSVITSNGESSTVIVEETSTLGADSTAVSPSSGSTVAQVSSSATNGTQAVTPSITSYEGGASRLINSISAVSFVAIIFGFFC